MNVNKSQLRNFGLVLALPVAAIGAVSVATDNMSSLVAHGPVQQGHVDVDCVGCHSIGVGTVRQQIQANLAYALGKRSTSVNFGFQPVTSIQCLSCHDRPNERHPIYRFNEPRFADVRSSLEVNSCVGCHSEHVDSRVSVSETLCSHCHDDLVLKNDPLDVQHDQLVVDDAWSSCLGCHDFHGNHPHESQTLLSDAFPVEAIRDYFGNGSDPYGSQKIYEATFDD